MLAQLILTTALLAPQDGLKKFEDKDLDLAFDYPENWKTKRVSYGTEFEFTVGQEVVMVRLIKAPVPGSKETYLQSLADVQTNNGGVIMRQWEEELLGVPLLLTQARFVNPTSAKIRLIGLLLTASQESMNFTLECSEAAFPEADKLWRQSLLTSRTVSGKLPGQGGTTSTNTNEPKEVKVFVWADSEGEVIDPAFTDNRQMADTDRGIYAYLPTGWALAGSKLTHPDMKGEAELLVGTGAEDTIKRAWLRMAGTRLTKMSSVSTRKETKPRMNAAGFIVRELTRIGVSEENPWSHSLLYGWAGGMYWIIDYSGTPTQMEADKVLLSDLAKLTGVQSQ